MNVIQAAFDQEEGSPAFSEDAIALAFAARHADDLRFVALWGRWMRWGGAHWRADDTLAAFDQARDLCREMAAQTNSKKLAAQIASAKTVAAVEKLAKADRRLASTVDQWDADPLAFNEDTT